MSANDWKVCPVCVYRAKQKLANGYGELDEDEYNELKEKVDNPYEHFRTLRVDYQHYAHQEDGQGYLDGFYGVKCEYCGFDQCVDLDNREEVLEKSGEPE